METYICYTDGGARGNPGPAGVGAVVIDPEGKTIAELSAFLGDATNNFAEYEAVIRTFRYLKKKLGSKTAETVFEFRLDSQLVVRQLNGEYKVKEEGLKKQYAQVLDLRSDFPHVRFTHIPREKNKKADALANKAMDHGK